MKHRIITALAAFTLVFSSLPARAHDAGKQMSEVARAFLGLLTPEQKAKAAFAFEDEERINWHFIPRERKGLPMKEMTDQQRLLAEGPRDPRPVDPASGGEGGRGGDLGSAG